VSVEAMRNSITVANRRFHQLLEKSSRSAVVGEIAILRSSKSQRCEESLWLVSNLLVISPTCHSQTYSKGLKLAGVRRRLPCGMRRAESKTFSGQAAS